MQKSNKPLQNNELEKGIRQNIGAAITGAAVAMAPQQATNTGSQVPSVSQEAKIPQKDVYSSKRMLNTISSVESNHGKYKEHAELSGIHSGERAYGKYGLTPNTIRETIKLNRDLSGKHKKAAALQGKDLHNYLDDNPGLEDQIAQAHLKRLEHHFGQDPNKIGYAWLQGIRGTYKQKDPKSIESHWHVQKIKNAYSKEK